jgi:hypothetical protein
MLKVPRLYSGKDRFTELLENGTWLWWDAGSLTFSCYTLFFIFLSQDALKRALASEPYDKGTLNWKASLHLFYFIFSNLP